MIDNKELDIFIDRLAHLIENKDLVKLVISKKRNKLSDLKKITISIVKLKDGLKLNFIYTHNTKDITKNYFFEQGLRIIRDSISNQFYNADIFSKNENISFISSKKGKVKLITKEPTFYEVNNLNLNHDKTKKRFIKTIDNIYLKELGITQPNGTVFHKKIDKYKQINRYVELLAPKLKEISTKGELNIIDMGSGKGYLTFALYDYLKNELNYDVKMTGIEFRQSLVDTCNRIAQKSGFNNLKFTQGTIEKQKLIKLTY